MASIWPLLLLSLLSLIRFSSSLGFPHDGLKLTDSRISPVSAISAAPASSSSSSAPSLSPDISPLFPTPGNANGGSSPPTESSSIPTIPASPSPPNPDRTTAPTLTPEPEMAISPTGLMPVSSSVSLHLSGASDSGLFLLGLMTFWVLQSPGV